MYINRRTFKVKHGAMEEAVKLVKAEIERTGWKGTVYTAEFGPFDVMVVDFSTESLEDYEKSSSEWDASPEAAKFFEKWYTLTERGGTNELWVVN